jgi:uncharacterized protein YecE (DUF72 family)
MTRGRFSRKLFEESCLEEYVSIFPTVCGDFAFYQFPSETFWTKLLHQSPAPFLWGFKVPEQITVPDWRNTRAMAPRPGGPIRIF